MFIKEIMAKHPVRFLKTVVIYLTFIALGLNIAVPGPTLLDLQEAIKTTLDQISLILPARSGGYALGAVFSKPSFC